MTQEHFRCKGSYEHSPDIVDGKFYFDCNGSEVHSLPTHRGEERVYPLLIELLGAFQELTGKEIVVTCGHRCPRHNQYADSTAKNRVSKHQVGGEVDFYVIGMEWESEKVVELLLYCYRLSKSIYKNSSFTRCKRQTLRTPTWKNQELEISISQLDERRDKDNDHSYPYITIELFYDYQTQKPVRYSWHSAHYSLFRYDFETSFR